MDKIFIAELLGTPSVVFTLFYAFMFTKNLNHSVEFSLFMALVTFLIAARKRFMFRLVVKRKPE